MWARSRACTLAPKATLGRPTDRPNERPTDQPDRTRERRLRLHFKRRTVAGVGAAPILAPFRSRSPMARTLLLLRPLTYHARLDQLDDQSPQGGLRRLDASPARWHHRTGASKLARLGPLLLSPMTPFRGMYSHSFDIRQYQMPPWATERNRGLFIKSVYISHKRIVYFVSLFFISR